MKNVAIRCMISGFWKVGEGIVMECIIPLKMQAPSFMLVDNWKRWNIIIFVNLKSNSTLKSNKGHFINVFFSQIISNNSFFPIKRRILISSRTCDYFHCSNWLLPPPSSLLEITALIASFIPRECKEAIKLNFYLSIHLCVCLFSLDPKL